MSLTVKELYNKAEALADTEIFVSGWVRTVRASKAFGFIELNDGTFFKSVQVVFEDERIDNFKETSSLNVGSAINVTGVLVMTPEAKQPFEIKASRIEIEGASTPDYP